MTSSRKRQAKGQDCCSATCRCMFGYFPWVPLIGCTALSVFVVFWKLWLDPMASKTRTLLASSGIKNQAADDFLTNCTLVTSVILIVSLVSMAALLILAVFKGHQRALHDAIYGQGQMPTRYYWLHLFFSMIMSGMLFVLVLIYISILVGVTFWFAGAIAAEASGFTALRVYVSNANLALQMGDSTTQLLDNFQAMRPELELADQAKVVNLLQGYINSTQSTPFPLQGKCKAGCLDLQVLSDVVDPPGTCKCSTFELRQLVNLAKDLQKGLKLAMGSIGFAIVAALILLMNTSSRITDTRRDLRDIRSPDDVPVSLTSRPKHNTGDAKLLDEEAGLNKSGHMLVSTAAARKIVPSGGIPPAASHTPLHHNVDPRATYPLPAQASRDQYVTTSLHGPHFSHSSSSGSSRPLDTSRSVDSYSRTTDSSRSAVQRAPAAWPAAAASNVQDLTSHHRRSHMAVPMQSGREPLAAASSSAPLAATAEPSSSSTPLHSSVSGSVDLKDGWKSIAAKYAPPEPQSRTV